jgi:hypothetical protein
MRLHKKPASCLFDETYLQIFLGKESGQKITTLDIEDDDKYESQKLKKYEQFLTEKYWDDEEGQYEDEEDDDKEQDIEHLKYLLRQMLTKAGIKNSTITNNGLNLKIQIIPPSYGMIDYFYKLDDIIQIYETIKKFDKDILVDFDLECDIWETKKIEPLLIFNFYSNQDDYEDESGLPF